MSEVKPATDTDVRKLDGSMVGSDSNHTLIVGVRAVRGLIARIDADAARIAALEEALLWYATQFCEHGRDFEGCGKMPEDYCSGCRARALLDAKP